MDKNDFKGFHNSFDAYCEWSEKQASLGLRSMNWGDWWDSLCGDIFDKDTKEDYPPEFIDALRYDAISRDIYKIVDEKEMEKSWAIQ